MNLWQHYLRPITVNDALKALASTEGPACPIAGGTDLMLDLQQGRHTPLHTLVDLTGIPEMALVEIHPSDLFIGAAAPLSRIANSPLVVKHAQALVEACHLIGGPQVRNMATLGGNVAHALPAADGTIALMALDARADVASLSGRRMIPLGELFLGPGQSALKAGQELLVGFYLPLKKAHQASAFKRVMRSQGIALPILNSAVWLERQGDRIARIRIAIGPSGTTPRRMLDAEQILLGQTFTHERNLIALEALLEQAHFRTSPHRASMEYRRHLVAGLFNETLLTAWERAKAVQVDHG
jgi:CO/xanthine dehydrogenase FAD-binding subunit